MRIEGPVVRVAQQGEPVVRPEGLPQLVRKPGDSTGYALAPEVDGDLLELELVSDGTGGGRTAGLAWASTWSVGQEGGEEGVEEVRGTGWVPGEAGSDRSELGGLVQMLREVCRVARARRAAGKRLRVARLVTDCEGARDAAEWAVSAPMGKVLTHKNRVLLLEWRGRMREAVELGVQVSIGWMKGHTDRTDWPYPVQAWCDEFAVAANTGGEEVEGEAQVALTVGGSVRALGREGAEAGLERVEPGAGTAVESGGGESGTRVRQFGGRVDAAAGERVHGRERVGRSGVGGEAPARGSGAAGGAVGRGVRSGAVGAGAKGEGARRAGRASVAVPDVRRGGGGRVGGARHRGVPRHRGGQSVRRRGGRGRAHAAAGLRPGAGAAGVGAVERHVARDVARSGVAGLHGQGGSQAAGRGSGAKGGGRGTGWRGRGLLSRGAGGGAAAVEGGIRRHKGGGGGQRAAGEGGRGGRRQRREGLAHDAVPAVRAVAPAHGGAGGVPRGGQGGASARTGAGGDGGRQTAGGQRRVGMAGGVRGLDGASRAAGRRGGRGGDVLRPHQPRRTSRKTGYIFRGLADVSQRLYRS